MPRIRTEPEDFQVEEIPLYEPTGRGAFLWLWIEKTGRNTQDVATELARELDVAPRDVGYAGRKDRRAITRQAFTVPATAEPRLGTLALDGVRMLAVEKTEHRLRTGNLRGNRFVLRVREVDAGREEELQDRFEHLVTRGLPNRYGDQRFGRDGRNVLRGREILLHTPKIRGDRRRAWLMVSALQSAVFNEVLARRPYDELWAGDVAVIHGLDDWLWIDDPATEAARLEAFELSPTGPIFGTKTKRPRGRAAELEREVMEAMDLPPVEQIRPPKGLQIYGDRRSLRVRPERGKLFFLPGEDAVQVEFDLPAGSYATVFLEELFPGGVETGPADP